MGFFDNLEKSKGGYIFISHSHDDIERVRIIRNELEKFGFEPYMGPKPVGWSAEADFEADAVRGWQIVREMQAKMKK